MEFRKSLAAAAGVLLAVAAVGCSSNDDGQGEDGETVIQMGVVPIDTVEETFNAWSFFNEILEEDTGYQIELYEATDLAAVVEAAVAGDLDLVHLGAFAQVMAYDNGAEMVPVGATADSAAGPETEAVAAVRADSGLSQLSDLEGEDVCFASPSSGTGYLFGAAALHDLGIDPETDVNPIFVGDHISAMHSMYDGECAAVFTYGNLPDFIFYDDNPDVEPGSVEVIWRTQVPEGGISMSTDLPQDVQDTLTEAILSINGTELVADDRCPDDRIVEKDGEPSCEPITPGWWGLTEIGDDYWDPVRRACEAVDAPACTDG